MTDRVEQLAEGIVLHAGDCLAVLPMLPANSFDSCVTDPPYHLTSGNAVYDFAIDQRGKTRTRRAPKGGGFMGKEWDGGDIAFRPEVWREVFRVLKPGAHLLAFGGTRTYHRMVCAIEDAGFEIRDCVQWIYASGFPKSMDVSKAIDRAAGAEREIIGLKYHARDGDVSNQAWAANGKSAGYDYATNPKTLGVGLETAPATDAARQWSGFGTALKPACELIVLARKPLSEPTVAANVLKWGCGALNIDGCRVGDDVTTTRRNGDSGGNGAYGRDERIFTRENPPGRWPANVIHDGSEEVVEAFPETKSGELLPHHRKSGNGLSGTSTFEIRDRTGEPAAVYGDQGSAARFFYTSKADSDDRLGSKHPTVKPLDLIQYLVRLVTPPKGLCLDPFAGTGTLGEACIRENMRAVLIEKEPEYQDDVRRRMRLAMAGPSEREREAIKAKMKDKPADHGPLFGAIA
jgi:DNA modification methylase